MSATCAAGADRLGCQIISNNEGSPGPIFHRTVGQVCHLKHCITHKNGVTRWRPDLSTIFRSGLSCTASGCTIIPWRMLSNQWSANPSTMFSSSEAHGFPTSCTLVTVSNASDAPVPWGTPSDPPRLGKLRRGLGLVDPQRLVRRAE